MKKQLILLLNLLLILPHAMQAEEITIKSGDTLSKIADEYNITIKSIMDANGIYEPNRIKAGQILKLPIVRSKSKSYQRYVVKEGDTISKIAIKHRVNASRLIRLNKITNPSMLYPNQILILPLEELKTNPNKINDPQFHIVLEGETLSYISSLYKKSLNDIMDLNNINDPNKIKAGRKLLLKPLKNSLSTAKVDSKRELKEGSSPEWREYGPLKVNWSSWKFIGESYIAPAKHDNGVSLFLAINCPSSKLNWRGKNGRWREWLSPVSDFEFNLLDQRCENVN